MSLLMCVYDHDAWDIRVGILFKYQFNEQTTDELIHRENDPKPEVSRIAGFLPPSLPSYRHRLGRGGDVVLEKFLDDLRGQTAEVSVRASSLSGCLVPLAASPKPTQDGPTDKFELGRLIHQPPFIVGSDMPYVN